jgi:hypothetical protein
MGKQADFGRQKALRIKKNGKTVAPIKKGVGV